MTKKSKSKIKPQKKAKVAPVAVVAAPAPAPEVPAPCAWSPEGLPHIDAFPPWRSPHETSVYLQISLPIVYSMIKAGSLESYVVGGRRRITSASIKYHMLPPSQRGPAIKYTEPYQRVGMPPNRWPKSKGGKKRPQQVAA